MFKLSQTDLRTKTDAELADLFNQASRQLAKGQCLTATFGEAASVLHLIRAELIRRGLRCD